MNNIELEETLERLEITNNINKHTITKGKNRTRDKKRYNDYVHAKEKKKLSEKVYKYAPMEYWKPYQSLHYFSKHSFSCTCGLCISTKEEKRKIRMEKVLNKANIEMIEYKKLSSPNLLELDIGDSNKKEVQEWKERGLLKSIDY